MARVVWGGSASRIAIAVTGATLVLTAGCTNTEDDPASAAGASLVASVRADAALHDRLPAQVRESGRLRAGVNTPYKPNEYKDSSGAIVGFDIDLLNAVSAKLGVTVEYQDADFDRIIPAIIGGSYDLGVSSFSDTAERRETVDFVNYYNSGIQWAQRAGKRVDPDNACGKTIAVQTNTTQALEELPAKSDACEQAGKPGITLLRFDSQDEAVNALVGGRVDGFSADSSITQYAVRLTEGRLELAGPMFDTVSYGYPLLRNSALGPVLRDALQAIIDDGTYRSILDIWGLGEGAIGAAAINGRTK